MHLCTLSDHIPDPPFVFESVNTTLVLSHVTQITHCAKKMLEGIFRQVQMTDLSGPKGILAFSLDRESLTVEYFYTEVFVRINYWMDSHTHFQD